MPVVFELIEPLSVLQRQPRLIREAMFAVHSYASEMYSGRVLIEEPTCMVSRHRASLPSLCLNEPVLLRVFLLYHNP